MKVQRGKDSNGPFYRSESGEKHHYQAGDKESRQIARQRAMEHFPEPGPTNGESDESLLLLGVPAVLPVPRSPHV
jgi:hypothetical protein